MENSKLIQNNHCEVHMYKCDRCKKILKPNILFPDMVTEHIGKLIYYN